jgi:hypothetical protein
VRRVHVQAHEHALDLLPAFFRGHPPIGGVPGALYVISHNDTEVQRWGQVRFSAPSVAMDASPCRPGRR